MAAIAGKVSLPAASIVRSRATPVVVSSVTPASRAATRAVLDDPRRQLGAVVDHDLRLGVCDGEQVGVELVGRRAVPRVHLDPARDERRADRVLGRAGFEPEATTCAPASASSVAR